MACIFGIPSDVLIKNSFARIGELDRLVGYEGESEAPIGAEKQSCDENTQKIDPGCICIPTIPNYMVQSQCSVPQS